jgi:putative tricarboxylic transport membrane protein
MDILSALGTILDPVTLIWFLMGTLLGITAGILPGIGASLTMALLIPVTFHLPPARGLVTLIGAWAAAVYGGSVSSILINTPGTGANVATVFDGFPMARDGKAKVALGISATSSMIGGMLGIGALVLFAPVLAALAMKFGPSEYFLLAIFGLSIISTTARGQALKGLIAAGVGLMISFIGFDVISGDRRFTFGTLYLEDGIPFLTVVIGLFAVTQILDFASEQGAVSRAGVKGSIWEGIKLTFVHWKTLIKSAAIGILFGFAPGVGTTAASMVAYSEAANSSSHPEKFGTGIAEGIVAPETANNAVQGGALIPTLTLGIPGNSDSAVFLAGLMMYGISPGRDLFVRNAHLVTILFVGLFLAQIAFWAMGLGMTAVFSKITLVPVNALMPMVWVVAAVGAFALHNNPMDVVAAIALGVVGFVMRRCRFPVVPMLMAVILGPIAEKNFMRAMMISDNSYAIFFKGSLNWIIWVLIVLALAFPSIMSFRRNYRRKHGKTDRTTPRVGGQG